jgi:hypothetical protein
MGNGLSSGEFSYISRIRGATCKMGNGLGSGELSDWELDIWNLQPLA